MEYENEIGCITVQFPAFYKYGFAVEFLFVMLILCSNRKLLSFLSLEENVQAMEISHNIFQVQNQNNST